MIDRFVLSTIFSMTLTGIGLIVMFFALYALAWVILCVAVVAGIVAFLQAINDPKSTQVKKWPPPKEKTA